jgi:hypothetical protein
VNPDWLNAIQYSAIRESNMKSATLLPAFLLVFLHLANACFAQADNVFLHGYGAWGYGRTDGNTHLLGNDDGSYDNVSLAMVMSAERDHRIRFSSAVWFLRGFPTDEEKEFEIDYAFAEWKFSDACRMRIGQVKQRTNLLILGSQFTF